MIKTILKVVGGIAAAGLACLIGGVAVAGHDAKKDREWNRFVPEEEPED